jgi:thioredoxin reductase (NADPH)
LNIPGEEEFEGKGVSHCATCDAAFFKDKHVCVIGGSNSAARASQLLAEYASQVTIIYRRDKLRAEPLLVTDLENRKNVDFLFNTTITEIKGEGMVKSVKLNNGEDYSVDGIFVEIGAEPCSEISKQLKLKMSKECYIEVDPGMRTSMKGVFAAGDLTTGSNNMWQLITAASEGALAAESVYEDLKKEKIEIQ